MYTQCPKCKTVFNLKAEQLKAANGKVRCSRCQRIFNAREHLYTLPEKTGITQQQRAASPKKTTSGKSGEKSQVRQPATDTTQPTRSKSATNRPAPASQKPMEEKTASEDWFDLTPQSPQPPVVEAKKTDGGKTPIEKPATAQPPSIEEELNGDLFKLFDEPEEITETKPASSEKSEISIDDLVMATDENKITVEEPTTREEDKEAVHPTAAENYVAEKNPSVEGYSLPPQLEAHPANSSMKTVFYLLGCLLMVAILAVQYAYSYRIPLQENETLKPWLDSLCQVTNCSMPPKRELEKIELVDNMMQSHPRYRNSLLVTATLINRADYVQPYPVVELTMSDLQQKIVARRMFHPKEYLVGETTEMHFAPNVEVALMLEIEDPGKDAVGFKFNFY